jgi:hypothetical protein
MDESKSDWYFVGAEPPSDQLSMASVVAPHMPPEGSGMGAGCVFVALEQGGASGLVSPLASAGFVPLSGVLVLSIPVVVSPPHAVRRTQASAPPDEVMMRTRTAHEARLFRLLLLL